MPTNDLGRVESFEDEENGLGDQDTVNSAPSYAPPPEAYEPTAQNVRRYPELFDAETIDSFNQVDLNDEAEAEAEAEADVDHTTVDEDDSDSATRVSF